DDGRAAYISRPPRGGPWPGVVVIHEIFGLNDDIRTLTDRIAGFGYLALAPDFYGGGRWTKCMKDAFRQLHAGRGEFFDAIEAAREWLAAQEDCSGRVGVIGFCLGGGFALMSASRYDFAAASVNYAEVPDEVERILGGVCPIVASYGGRDRTLRGHPERLEQALTAAGVEHDVKVYPNAGHSFLSEQGYPFVVGLLSKLKGMAAGPHEAAAQDAWRRIDAFFANHLR
ncbi:MAG: dienelactone hydrolase family protein, partial [Steroidobacteraceae bacterium]